MFSTEGLFFCWEGFEIMEGPGAFCFGGRDLARVMILNSTLEIGGAPFIESSILETF